MFTLDLGRLSIVAYKSSPVEEDAGPKCSLDWYISSKQAVEQTIGRNLYRKRIGMAPLVWTVYRSLVVSARVMQFNLSIRLHLYTLGKVTGKETAADLKLLHKLRRIDEDVQ